MSVRRKLISGYLVVALLVAATGFVAWRAEMHSAERASVTEAVQVARTIGKDVAYGLAPDTAGEHPEPLYAHPESLGAYLERMQRVQDRDIVVVDRNQVILGDAVPENVGTVFDVDSGDEVGATIRDRQSRVFVETSKDYPEGIKQVVVPLVGSADEVLGAVVLEYTPLYEEMMGTTRETQLVILAADVACILLVLLLGVLVARSMTRRITVLREAVRDVRDGEYSRRVTASGRDEIHQLGQAFNDMAEQLERSARQILGKEYTDSILANAGEGICGLNTANRVAFANAAAGRITGLGVAGLLGKDVATVLPAVDLSTITDDGTAAEAHATTHEGTLFRPDGTTARVAYTANRIRKDDRPIGAVIVLRDVSRQRELERDLRHQALHDGLTGLPNRRLFLDRLDQALRRSASGHGRVGVLFLDLDGFKRVNDSLGHNAGDALLCTAADRLRAAARSNDTVARFGGDEFAVLVEPADQPTLADLAQRCLTSLAEPFVVQGREVTVTVSIGVVPDAGEYADAHEVVRNADVAMYTAKEQGKDRFQVFAPELHARVLDRLEQEARLRAAVERDELRIHLQPIVEATTRRVRGVEALVRWQDPRRGLQQPGSFIPLAEETGIIVEIDRWVLLEACRTVRRWQDTDPETAPGWLSVNLSAAQLEVPDLTDQVAHALASSGLAPDKLVLELTETILMRDVSLAITRLEQLRELGVRIAIDDFGTGYSSLGYLRDIPIDVLKIDRSFVAGLDRSRRHRDLVTAVIQLGHTLGLKVVAEGVEEKPQLTALAEIGCPYVQGFYLGRPEPAADLVARLRAEVSVPV